VHKVINCISKSHKERVKRLGLQEIITDDNRVSTQKMKDIRKIAQSIDKVITIEAAREQTIDPAELANPYLTKNFYETKRERIPVAERSALWVEQKRHLFEQMETQAAAKRAWHADSQHTKSQSSMHFTQPSLKQKNKHSDRATKQSRKLSHHERDSV